MPFRVNAHKDVEGHPVFKTLTITDEDIPEAPSVN
jgi:hypothetical protein